MFSMCSELTPRARIPDRGYHNLCSPDHHYHHQGAPVVAFHIMKGGWTTVTTLYTVFARKLGRKMKMILNILLCAIKLRRGRKKKPQWL